jgi:hypothetical protein
VRSLFPDLTPKMSGTGRMPIPQAKIISSLALVGVSPAQFIAARWEETDILQQLLHGANNQGIGLRWQGTVGSDDYLNIACWDATPQNLLHIISSVKF